MKMLNFILASLLALPLFANAEVFKCKNATGKIVYQAEPCSSGAVTQGVINVKKMTPEEEAAAKAKLNTWREQQAADDAAKREAEQARQIELERQESLELQRRGVNAQEQQAIGGQQQQYQNNGPIIVSPHDYNRRYWNNGMQSPYGQWGQPTNPYYRPNYGGHPINPNGYPSFRPYQEPPPPPFRKPAFIGKPNPQPVNPRPGFYDYNR